MNYEKINKVLMEILERKYNIKINAKVKERSENKWKNLKENYYKCCYTQSVGGMWTSMLVYGIMTATTLN